jgi:hypothetical protein
MRRRGQVAGIDQYRQSLRAAVYGLWRGAFTEPEFYDSMIRTIETGLGRAWNEGAGEVGILPEEFTQEEIFARDAAILQEIQYITRFGSWIASRDKASGGLLRDLMYRMSMWVNKYNDIRNLAMQVVGADLKLTWRLGPTKEHCSDCANYNGRVYRASLWRKYNIRPQSRGLECKGYKCQCRLSPTNAPATPGRPPSMRG